MPKTAPLSKGQRGLLNLINANLGKVVSLKEILAATGWKVGSWKTTYAKGDLRDVIANTGRGRYRIASIAGLDEWDLRRRLSQSTSGREFSSSCRRPLARALVRKARENIILALEIYNRPSLENRLDSFSMLFSTAWEQLLKAEIVEQSGDSAVFRAPKKGKRRESFSLQECINDRLGKKDPARANLERIAELRHDATHLLMPPAQPVLSRLFQAGVINFAKRFQEFTQSPLLPRSSVGLLSIVGEDRVSDAIDLRKAYGKITADDIASMIQNLEGEIQQRNDSRFAVSVEYSLALTKKAQQGDITLTPGTGASLGVAVVAKPVPIERTHPYTVSPLRPTRPGGGAARANSGG